MPSKIFETMAWSSIIMGVEGEARDIVNGSATWHTDEPDSAESLVEAVETACG